MASRAYVQWLPCPVCGNRTHGIIRIFAEPLGEIVDGMPSSSWWWCCNLELREGGVAHLRAAKDSPSTKGYRALRNLFDELGVTTIEFERIKAGTELEIHAQPTNLETKNPPQMPGEGGSN